jgi:hypothetical protein
LTDELRVDGRVTVYRLHDIGYAIALDRAAELLGAGPTSRVRPERLEARAIEIRNPPISVPFRSLDLTLDRGVCPATVSAHLFDFGVCSLQVQVQAPSGLSWSSFADFGASVERSPDLKAVFDETLATITQRVAAAVDRPAVAPVSEDYRVIASMRSREGARLLFCERCPTSNSSVSSSVNDDRFPTKPGES